MAGRCIRQEARVPERPSAHGSEVEHTDADPSDLQHVSDGRPGGCDGKPSRCARGPVRRAGGRHIRFPHSRSRGTRNSGFNWRSACDAVQGSASTVEARDFCKHHGLQVSMRFNPRDLGDRAAGILARVERPTPSIS